jgi:hypothetical protein
MWLSAGEDSVSVPRFDAPGWVEVAHGLVGGHGWSVSRYDPGGGHQCFTVEALADGVDSPVMRHWTSSGTALCDPADDEVYVYSQPAPRSCDGIQVVVGHAPQEAVAVRVPGTRLSGVVGEGRWFGFGMSSTVASFTVEALGRDGELVAATEEDEHDVTCLWTIPRR